jgi:hypothetical protein
MILSLNIFLFKGFRLAVFASSVNFRLQRLGFKPTKAKKFALVLRLSHHKFGAKPKIVKQFTILDGFIPPFGGAKAHHLRVRSLKTISSYRF